jgi:nanoRNase/pAp phosphatase (c-di-AMP/oligoRNAs hydrolase)
MALTGTQQILETIKRSHRPLICVPSGAGADGYASALGLKRVLTKLDKAADIVASDGPVPKTLQFLEGHAAVLPRLENLRQLVIELDASQTDVHDVSHRRQGDKLQIFLSPKSGSWNPKDVKLSTSGYKYDLIICLGASDLEACAHIYRENPDFFYNTTIINIDHAPENEHYGHLNVVDLTAAACGEVCHDLVEAIEPGLMDEETATAFLTGMIAKTKSFRRPNVTPKTLQIAGKLLAHGAKRDLVVHHLFRTRSVATLRLWGRALARLKSDPAAKIVWTLLAWNDFMHAGAEESDLPDVIDELIASSPDAKVVVLLYENKDQHVCGLIRTERPLDALHLAANSAANGNPTGTREEVRVCFKDKTIVQVEQELIEKLKVVIKK